jgi:hypothetical protein
MEMALIIRGWKYDPQHWKVGGKTDEETALILCRTPSGDVLWWPHFQLFGHYCNHERHQDDVNCESS